MLVPKICGPSLPEKSLHFVKLSVYMHLSRENWTLPGAQRAYSSQSNAAYQARNYASNINEYNKVLGEISLRKQ